MSILRELLRFSMVGAIGFAVDGGVLMTLVLGGVDALIARLVSFPAAVFVTWWFNRHWTFSGSPKSRPHRQFGIYFVAHCWAQCRISSFMRPCWNSWRPHPSMRSVHWLSVPSSECS